MILDEYKNLDLKNYSGKRSEIYKNNELLSVTDSRVLKFEIAKKLEELKQTMRESILTVYSFEKQQAVLAVKDIDESRLEEYNQMVAFLSKNFTRYAEIQDIIINCDLTNLEKVNILQLIETENITELLKPTDKSWLDKLKDLLK